MKHMKKLLSLVLALVMCLSLAVPAFAAKSEFDISGTTLKKYNGAGGNVIIPPGITTISNHAFRNNKDITSVTMPDSVTSIGNYAFEKCGALKTVYLSNNLTSIGLSAFSDCTSLQSVVLPNSVTSIGWYAFQGCTSMKTLTLSNNLVSMGNGAFKGCTSLLSISVPGSVREIPPYAFDGCSSAKSIVLYEGVTEIGTSGFNGCNSATTLTLPASLKSSGSGGVNNCKGLRDVYYGGSEDDWKQISMSFLYTSYAPQGTIHYNSPMPEPAPSFRDVSVSQYYAGPVAWAAGSGIANGTNTIAGTFSPANTCTQAQILTFLYRGARNANSAIPIAASASDMDEAVQWARDMGMIDSSFVGSTLCTRATAVYYIWMAFGAVPASGSTFTDVPSGASYAAAVSWAVQKGITTGATATKFSPNNTCTRGQIVTFLYRAYVG